MHQNLKQIQPNPCAIVRGFSCFCRASFGKLALLDKPQPWFIQSLIDKSHTHLKIFDAQIRMTWLADPIVFRWFDDKIHFLTISWMKSHQWSLLCPWISGQIMLNPHWNHAKHILLIDLIAKSTLYAGLIHMFTGENSKFSWFCS